MPLFLTKRRVQELTSRAASAARDELGRELKDQADKHRRVQELLVDNILALQQESSKYVGNEYRRYEDAARAISDKYCCRAEWGCLQTRTVIDLRAAFILGDGIRLIHKTKTKAEAEAELEWARDFISYNLLDAEMPQEMAKEAEIEGKIALRLFWDDLADEPFRGRSGMPSVRFLSWLEKRYKVEADPQDYLWYRRLVWQATAKSGPGSVPEEEFVYKKFGGRLHEPDDAQPRVMGCLTQLERLDKALRDLREIDHLFASQTPDFKVETPQQGAALLKQLEDTNWRIGKAIVHVGDFSLKGPDTGGVQNLLNEIELSTKLISGTVGIPPHFLGFVDLLSTRATGDNTRELVMAATTRERLIWTGVFNELLEKAMRMYNVKTGAAQKASGRLDPTKVGVAIPLISEDHWRHLASVLIPAQAAGIVSKDFVASQIPGVDLEAEQERAAEAEENSLRQAEEELARMRKERFAARKEDEDV